MGFKNCYDNAQLFADITSNSSLNSLLNNRKKGGNK